ncbi:MAG: hypothetical protein ACI9GH_000022 [Candidatus Paceibacteria bacterium]
MQKYGIEKTFLSQMGDVMYQYFNENIKEKKLSEYIQYFLDKFNSYSLSDMVFNISDLQRILGKYNIFDGKLDDMEIKNSYLLADPTNKDNPIRDVAEFITITRDAYVIKKIKEKHSDRNAQFIVYGRSHVFVWEPILRELGLLT